MSYIEASTFLGLSVFLQVPWRLWLHTNADVLDSTERAQLENTVNELAQKMGISKNIEVVEVEGILTKAQAIGNNLLPGRAGIAIDPHFYKELNSGEAEFLISHELAHIKNNDSVKIGGISLLGLITYIALIILFPATAIFVGLLSGSTAAAIATTVSVVAFVFLSRIIEEQADKTGFQHCSEEGKKHASSFFQKIKDDQLNFKNSEHDSLWNKFKATFLVTSDGENRLDILHPSLKTRISYLQYSDSPAVPVTLTASA